MQKVSNVLLSFHGNKKTISITRKKPQWSTQFIRTLVSEKGIKAIKSPQFTKRI